MVALRCCIPGLGSQISELGAAFRGSGVQTQGVHNPKAATQEHKALDPKGFFFGFMGLGLSSKPSILNPYRHVEVLGLRASFV